MDRPVLSLRGTLLSALLVSSALAPPELGWRGLALATTFAASLAILLLLPGSSGEPPRLFRRAGISLLLATLAISIATSSQPHRSLGFLLGAGIALVAWAGARLLGREANVRFLLLGTTGVVGTLVALRGLFQSFLGLSHLAALLRAEGRTDLDPLILRAESGRAFGPFQLPSSLGIFLAMTIPATLLCRHRSRPGRRGRALWTLALFIQLCGMAATFSFGAVMSFLAAMLLIALIGRAASLRSRVVLISFASGLALSGFALIRASEGASPLLLRMKNWSAAIEVFLGSPWLGVGFGGFGDAYTAALSEGMNETLHAHNSYLQIAAEGGIVALVAALAGAAAILVSSRRLLERSRPGSGEWLLALPPVAFLFHNLVDFSAYLPSLSVTFAALAGLVRSAGSADPQGVAPLRASPGVRAALLLLILGGAGWGWRESLTRRWLEEGKDRLEAGDLVQGIELLRRAARWDPSDPDPPAFIAEVTLAHLGEHPEWREEGERFARKGVEARPERARGHYTLGAYRLADGDPGEAWVELSRARALHPSGQRYRDEERRLREILGGRNGEGPGR